LNLDPEAAVDLTGDAPVVAVENRELDARVRRQLLEQRRLILNGMRRDSRQAVRIARFHRSATALSRTAPNIDRRSTLAATIRMARTCAVIQPPTGYVLCSAVAAITAPSAAAVVTAWRQVNG